jgi:hypothetical protein
VRMGTGLIWHRIDKDYRQASRQTGHLEIVAFIRFFIYVLSLVLCVVHCLRLTPGFSRCY